MEMTDLPATSSPFANKQQYNTKKHTGSSSLHFPEEEYDEYPLSEEQVHEKKTPSDLAADPTLALTKQIAQLSAVDTSANVESVTQWQRTLKTDPAEISSVQTLYDSCLDYYYTMLPVWLKSTECKEEVRRTLYRNYVLLRDWGISYSVLEGQLDQLPEEADDLVETLLSFLHEISQALRSK
jgi:hypothetical protein